MNEPWPEERDRRLRKLQDLVNLGVVSPRDRVVEAELRSIAEGPKPQPTRVLTYLACPYSHPNPRVRAERFDAANRAAGHLMRLGHMVFSPISHTHPIAEECDLPKGWDFWEQFDRAYLAASRMLIVLCIDGWRESVGVAAEIRIAQEMEIPVEYVRYE